MGNIFTISGDAILSRCLDCWIRRAKCVRDLEANLDALQNDLQKLIEERNDLRTRVNLSEQNHMQRTEQVQGWLSRVQVVEAEASELQNVRSQEIEKLCLGGYCSKKYKSSYKFGKKVAKTLRVVAILRGEGAFEVITERAPEDPVDKISIEPTIVGLQSTFDKVWSCLGEEQEGIIGLYGTGGVGKTTLLKQINNKFYNDPNGFDVVIWVVVSKDLQPEIIQEKIAKKISLFDASWENKSIEEKASRIFKVLSKKKFVLLLDDIWEQVDLIKIGVPFPSLENASKIVFTTREFKACCTMEAKCFKVECLAHDDAWKLFKEKVGRAVLDSHYKIPKLAKIIAEECGGLPLALITVGRAMACKKSPQEWELAIEVLRKSAYKFSDLEKKVYSCLKFSYDNLNNETTRSCLLYCSLFPEDYSIDKEELIDCWIGEGFLDEDNGSGARNQGYSIIGALLCACLLDEDGDCIKMHDVIRDMVLWIVREIEKEKENFLVHAGMGLIEAPKIGEQGVKRMSLMKNEIVNLLETPTCPNLQTLFLNYNHIRMITSDFFQYMPSLKVLNLSNNSSLTEFPFSVSKLVSLQFLDLSGTDINKLPIELKSLVNLKCLDLERTRNLHTIPCQLISNFSKLVVLRMLGCGYVVSRQARQVSVLFGGGELLVEELVGLKCLNLLTISLRSSHALQRFLSSIQLQSCARSLSLEYFEDSKSLNVLALADLNQLQYLKISDCKYLEELKIENIQPYGFYSLQKVVISQCYNLRELTWLAFAPNLEFLYVLHCEGLVEIISDQKLDEVSETMANQNLFENLKSLELIVVRNLRSIYRKPLPFPHLQEILVAACPNLKKLPLDSNSAKERKIVIKGKEHWWKGLQWEDDTTRKAFLPCFQSQ